MSPMNRVDEDSEISDEEEEEERVDLGASAVEKKEGYLDPKNGGIELLVTSLVDEAINTSDEDSLLGNNPVTGRVDKSQEVEFHQNGRQDEDGTWYAINQEAEALFHFTRCAFPSGTYKANRGKRGPNILLHSRAFGEDKSRSDHGCGYSSDLEELESDGESPQRHKNDIDHMSTENSVVEVLETFRKEKKQRLDIIKVPVEQRLDIIKVPVEIIPLQSGYVEHSAVELLDIIQEKTILDGDLDNRARNKRRRSLSEKKSASTLGDRILNNEDPSEPICSTSSNDDEESEPTLELAAAEAPEKTMADRIQEAIVTSKLNDYGIQYASSKPLGLGLFGKLQQVIQVEKETDANFLMIQQSIEHTHDASSCLDVKILSRYLEGKLVVCRCSVTDNRGGLDELNIPGTMKEHKDSDRVLIFNLRICDDIDLDVGNCVRVHSPWKEVTTAGHGVIVLCSYLSQIKSDDG